ncbi:hypothetical protein ACFX2F_013160 [Malus domestica]
MVKIGTTLSPLIWLALISFLQENTEVFAWSYEDMLGIFPDIIYHRLSIDPKTKPVRQKRRSYDAERYEVMKAEVEKLKSIGFIGEVNYPTWVANVVLVKKNPTKESLLLQKVLWRMCVDYTDLNKGCPNDSFRLPLIDRLIDFTVGCELLSFMDAYSGYNQILMNPPDQEHTAFTTDRGLYFYKVMPFGLKNAGATYQRLVNSMFAEHIGKSMEVYVDDMLVKSKHVDQHITNLFETFTILKRYRMRLNPNNKFRMFCCKFKINLCFASPAHPQFNGQVEAINKIIKRTLKTSLEKAKGYWPEFVPQVLWSYRTLYRTSTGETPFSLAFGIEAVVPVELKQATFRVQNYVQSENDKQLTLNLDLVEEHRNQAHLRNVAYKQRISNYYDSRVKPCSFKVGDWVLKKRLLDDGVPSEGTLSPN